MDNFGIFKLLGSLYNAFNKQNSNKNDPDINPAFEKNQLKPANEKPSNKSYAYVPLQNNMLDLIKKHDEFVNRVKDKNKTL